MKFKNFCCWLHGYLKLNSSIENKLCSLSSEQVKTIQAHLNLCMNNDKTEDNEFDKSVTNLYKNGVITVSSDQ